MLKRQILIYDDGRKTDELIYVDNNSSLFISPKEEGIKHAYVCSFKYKIRLKPLEFLSIITLQDKTILMPRNIKVHPKTTLEDVEVTIINPKKIKPLEYTFKSSSSDKIYTVKKINGEYKCNCSGFFRIKDKSQGCTHIKSLNSK